jgi:hypothetical protein
MSRPQRRAKDAAPLELRVGFGVHARGVVLSSKVIVVNKSLLAAFLAGSLWSGLALAQATIEVPAGSAGAGGPVESQVVKPEDVEARGKPEVPSFQRGSNTRAGGPANELNTNDGRKNQELPGGSVRDVLAGTDLYHGNHCGKGTRGADLPPTDELDASCLRHDQCYDRAGRASCACDKQLRREALTVSTTGRLSRELRARALSVAQAAELMECEEP